MLDKIYLTLGGAFIMGKYSYKIKVEIIQYYLNHHSINGTAKYFDVGYSNVKEWVHIYNIHGI
jgi:transposase-like protein